MPTLYFHFGMHILNRESYSLPYFVCTDESECLCVYIYDHEECLFLHFLCLLKEWLRAYEVNIGVRWEILNVRSSHKKS